MQRQQPLGDLRFTAPMPSLPVFPSGFQSTFSRPYQDLQPNSTNHHPATIQYMDAQSQSLCAPGYPVSAPPSALSSPALPNEVFFSPFAHEYTSYFSLEATEPPARRNTPFVHRRSRVVMACTYCRRRYAEPLIVITQDIALTMGLRTLTERYGAMVGTRAQTVPRHAGAVTILQFLRT